MKHFYKGLAAGLLGSLLAIGSASAQVITIATGAQGSTAYSSGEAVAAVANSVGIIARTQPLVGYVPLVNSGEVDFGFLSSAEAEYAYTGAGNFDRASPNLRMVGVMFPLTTGLMAPCDLGLETMADVKAKAGELKIASDYASSTIIPFYIQGALANVGLTYDDLRQVPVSSFVAGIEALGSGLVDIALVSLNAGAGQQASVALKDRGGLCYISLDNSAEGEAAFKKFMPTGYIVTLPQNEKVNGLEKRAANIVRIPWMMVTNADVDEDLVYTLTKAVAENNKTLAESFGLFGLVKPETLAPANVMPYHPGAIRYYEEAGIKVGS